MQAVSRWLWQAYMLKSDDGAYITLSVHIPGHTRRATLQHAENCKQDATARLTTILTVIMGAHSKLITDICCEFKLNCQ